MPFIVAFIMTNYVYETETALVVRWLGVELKKVLRFFVVSVT